MQIFALETNINALKATFTNPGETEVLVVFRSIFFFLVRTIIIILFGALITALYVLANQLGPLAWYAHMALLIVAFIGVVYPLFTAFIQWRYSFIDVFDDQIVVVFQYSLFRRDIQQINLEEFVGQKVLTQFLNIFPFGILLIELRGGHATDVRIGYVPNVLKVADTIADVVSKFQSA